MTLGRGEVGLGHGVRRERQGRVLWPPPQRLGLISEVQQPIFEALVEAVGDHGA